MDSTQIDCGLKTDRVAWCNAVLTRFKEESSNLVWDLVTGDETWIYCYDPKTKQQSTVWVSSQPGKRPALPYESYAQQTSSFMPKCADFFTFSYLWIVVPAEKFEDIIENVLLEEMPLVALRVFFCKTCKWNKIVIHRLLIGICNFVQFQPMMLHHIVETYCSTFKELQWVDAQLATSEMNRHVSTRLPQPFRRETSINPLILVCWQCNVLEKIVLHGYWLWQYDLLGMARLRHSTLRHLEVSATYQKEMGCRVITEAMTILPVFVGKEERNVDPSFIKQMNDCLNFEWRPCLPWNQLHPALGPHSNETLRSDYVRNEIMTPLGVT
ncbi:F-box only protein 33 [Eumeta japonica]|uniref:F-box only protein 33 n=1 Tax=Eumeta variegata TaxID=151549 RepID=A0A4C1TS68_EUMVA|nr:F-box only protein 33 [Eumeta japonica]